MNYSKFVKQVSSSAALKKIQDKLTVTWLNNSAPKSMVNTRQEIMAQNIERLHSLYPYDGLIVPITN